MKPKLILLNGIPGMGKSTLSQRYVNEHPMSLNLDVDRLWQAMGGWQEHIALSTVQRYKLAYAVAEAHLKEGWNVIVADMLQEPELNDQFEQIAHTCDSVLKEFVLIAPVGDAIERCKIRARALGYPSGFRPGGVLDTGGREKLLRTMHSDVAEAAKSRPNTVFIESEYGNPDSTYESLLAEIDS